MRISDWSSDVCSSDLSARLLDISSYDEAGAAAIEAITQAARNLPSDGWLARLGEGDPFGPIERMLAEVRGTALARARAQDAGYGLETEAAELDSGLVAAAGDAVSALEALARPIVALPRRRAAGMRERRWGVGGKGGGGRGE